MAVMARGGRGLGSERVREALVGYAFIVIPMFSFLVFSIYPLFYALYISRYEWGILGKIEPLGLENYRELLRDDLFGKAVKNTLLYTGVVVPCQMALGLGMAVIVNQALRFRTFFRAAFYFPSLASSAAITAIAIFILSSDGLLNSLLGTNRAWFAHSDTALPSIMGLNIWTTSGTMMLFYLASLQSISTDVYEAAAIDGARTWRTFWKITFPLLKPGHFFVLVVSVIGSLQLFDQAFIASGGGGGPNYATTTMVLYLFQTTVQDFRFGYGAALGVALFVLIFTLTLIQRLLFGRTEAA